MKAIDLISLCEVHKDLTPSMYKSVTGKMNQSSTVRSKLLNSVFTLFVSPDNKFHLFHKMFDQDEFDGGFLTPERANRIIYYGVSSRDGMKRTISDLESKIAKSGDRVVLAKQTPWTTREMGL